MLYGVLPFVTCMLCSNRFLTSAGYVTMRFPVPICLTQQELEKATPLYRAVATIVAWSTSVLKGKVGSVPQNHHRIQCGWFLSYLNQKTTDTATSDSTKRCD